MDNLKTVNTITNSLINYLITQTPKTSNPYEIYNDWSLQVGYRFKDLSIMMICINLIKSREKIQKKSELVLKLMKKDV